MERLTNSEIEDKTDSLKKRYLFKLLANLIGLPTSLIIQALIPRALGPNLYGDYNFLTNFFSQVVGFFDMGTSTGFYTKISQRPEEKALITFYLYFSSVIVLLIFGVVVILETSTIKTIILPGQKIFYIYLAAGWSVLTWLTQVMEKMADAYGLTVSTEKARIIQKILITIIIVILFNYHLLQLTNFFIVQYIVIIFFITTICYIIKNNKNLFPLNSLRLPYDEIIIYCKELYQYSHPLFTFALAGLAANLFDRWLLQIICGSVQQGFFSLSYQVGVICFLFTSAMTPLLIREFSIAFSKKNLTEMRYLFRRYIPVLYSIAAYFSCFVAVQASNVIQIMGGKNFKGAIVPVTIMSFYPILQTYGQLSGAVFYATGQTAIYRNIGIVFLLIGIPLTYFFIAPRNWMGLDAGASGLAAKILLVQLIGINVQLFFNARLLRLGFWRYVMHQFGVAVLLVTIALIAKFTVDLLPYVYNEALFNFTVSGVIYTIIVIVLLLTKPVLFGLNQEDCKSIKLILSRGVLIKNKQRNP